MKMGSAFNRHLAKIFFRNISIFSIKEYQISYYFNVVPKNIH